MRALPTSPRLQASKSMPLALPDSMRSGTAPGEYGMGSNPSLAPLGVGRPGSRLLVAPRSGVLPPTRLKDGISAGGGVDRPRCHELGFPPDGSELLSPSWAESMSSSIPAQQLTHLAHLDPLLPQRLKPSGMPYLEHQRKLVKRNRVLEQSLKRLDAQVVGLLHEREDELLRRTAAATGESAEAEAERESAERKSAEATRQHEAEMERLHKEHEHALQDVRDACRAKAAHEQRLALERQLVELMGSAEEQAAVQAAKEKEERVELVKRQFGRRMHHLAVTRGFGAWVEMWAARTSALALLRHASNMLQAPDVKVAFSWWAEHTAEERRQVEAAADLAARERELSLQKAQLHSDIAQIREMYEAKLAAAEDSQRLALERQLVELMGSAEEQAALRLEKDKETRVEEVRRRFVRRILQQGLSRGFAAWVEAWEEGGQLMRRLRESGNRLRTPQVSGAFSFWWRDWKAAVNRAAEATHRRRWTGLQAEVSEMHALLTQTRGEGEAALAAAEGRHAAEMARALAAFGEELRAKTEALRTKGREERIERVTSLMARRMLQRDLYRGWVAWHGQWRVVAQAARARDAEYEHATRAELEASLFEAESNRVADAAEAARRLEAVQAASESALERQRIELMGSTSEMSRVREEREREARAARMAALAVRRLRVGCLDEGWTAWVEMWAAKVGALTQLRAVANRMRAPALSAGFTAWARVVARERHRASLSASEVREAAVAHERSVLLAELNQVREASEGKIAELNEERLGLLEKVAALSGGEAERDALLAAEREAGREERVEMLRRQVGRRLVGRDLSRGWTAWVDSWAERTDSLARLRRVASRLRSPALAETFVWWARDASEAQRLSTMSKAAVAEEGLRRELEAVRSEYERRLVEASEEKAEALRRQLVELAGSAEEQAALQAAKEKEERVELVKRQFGRRMHHLAVTRGFGAWVEMWEAKVGALERLRECANGLHAPLLSQTFRFWAASEAEERMRLEREKTDQESRSLEAQLRRARHEASQATLTRTAAEDQLHFRGARIESLETSLATAEKAAAAAAALQAELDETLVALLSAHAATEMAERLRVEAEDDGTSQRKTSQELLEKLLHEQRCSFEEERARLVAQQAAGTEHYRELGDQIGRDVSSLRDEVKGVRAELSLALEEKAKATREGEKTHEEVQRVAVELELYKGDVIRLREELDAAAGEVRRLERELALQAGGPIPRSSKDADDGEHPNSVGRSPSGRKKIASLGITLDAGPDAPPVSKQIAAALRSAAGRVLDLFRAWDTDGDGEVSRKEFHEAIVALGLDAPKEEIDVLFDEWDRDGGGALDYQELTKILRTSAPPVGTGGQGGVASKGGKVRPAKGDKAKGK